MLVQTRAVNQRALLVPNRWEAEELRERTKNLIIFKERSHKKRRDHTVYCSEIKTYYLAITMNKVSERPSESTVDCGILSGRSASLIFPVASTVDLKMIIWFCTDSTGEKGLRESKSFSKIPTTITSSNSERKITLRAAEPPPIIPVWIGGIDFVIYIIIGFFFALGLVKILEEEKMLTRVCSGKEFS